jgi:serine/threonine-protein kinase
MTPARYAEIKNVFGRALELGGANRAAFLDTACAGDDELRAEVEALLAANDTTGSFLDSPPASPAVAQQLAGAVGAGLAGATADVSAFSYCVVCNTRFDSPHHACPDHGDSLVEDRASLVGTTIDGLYQVEAVVGRGAMGTVYRARHLLLRDPVAIKLLPHEVSTDPARLSRFLREGQAARRFRHPNCVAVHDLRTSPNGLTYMVLEYVDGETLRAVLRRRVQIPFAECLDLLEPIADALDAAHASGVIHRDVKPANVMVGRDSAGQTTVKLLDLGIAKVLEAVDETSPTTLTGDNLQPGTPAYMSPEQWGWIGRDGNPEVDGRADVYSVAVMLFEMVSGKRPFAESSVSELRLGHMKKSPPRLADRGVEAHGAVEEALARGLAKDRDDRPPSVRAFVASMRAALVAAPLATPPEAEALAEVGTFEAETVAELSADPSTMSLVQAPLPPRTDGRRIALIALASVLAGAVLAVLLMPLASAPAPVPTVQPPPAGAPAAATPVVALRYEILVSPASGAAGDQPPDVVLPGQDFRFRFTPTVAGRLYLVAPGRDEVPQTFLTDQPIAQSGLTTNAVAARQELTFPSGRQWFGVEDIGKPTVYTVVFAAALPPELAFLAEPAGRPLGADEVERLDAFRRSHGARVARPFDGRNSPEFPVFAEPERLESGLFAVDIEVRHRLEER